jgi:hypothetical protein
VHADVTWVSAYDVDPFVVPDGDKVALLADWSSGLLGAPGVDHVTASLQQVLEDVFTLDRVKLAHEPLDVRHRHRRLVHDAVRGRPISAAYVRFAAADRRCSCAVASM